MKLLLLQLVAFWPVWGWSVARLTDGSDDPLGPLALGTAIAVLGRSRVGSPPQEGEGVEGSPLPSKLPKAREARRQRPEMDSGRTPGRTRPSSSPRDTRLSLALSSVAAGLYILGQHRLPALARAVLAMISLAATASTFTGRGIHGGVLGLLILSLPVVASLQFFLGYPLRCMTTRGSALLLSWSGVPVGATGTTLLCAGERIFVDAPCSGVRMLWTGLYLHFTLASLGGLGNRWTWVGYGLTSIAVFAGNLVRTLLIFLVETGRSPVGRIDHDTLGLGCFVVVCGAIALGHRWIGRIRCDC